MTFSLCADPLTIERRKLSQPIEDSAEKVKLGCGGRDVAIGIGLTILVLLLASALDLALGVQPSSPRPLSQW